MVRGLSWWTTDLNLKMLFAALCVPTHPQYTCPYSYLARWKKNTGLAIICSSFKELFAGLTVQVEENYTSHIWQSFSSVGRACEDDSQLIWFFLWSFSCRLSGWMLLHVMFIWFFVPYTVFPVFGWHVVQCCWRRDLPSVTPAEDLSTFPPLEASIWQIFFDLEAI